MTRALFAVALCLASSCRLDSQPDASSGFDVKPTPWRELEPGEQRNHAPAPQQTDLLPASMPVAGRAQSAGAQAIMQLEAHAGGAGGAEVTRIRAAGGGAPVPFDAGTATEPAAMAGSGAAVEAGSGAGSAGRDEPVTAHEQDAGGVHAQDASTLDAALNAVDAAAAKDAEAGADAARAGTGGDRGRDDHIVREALRDALIQLLLDLGNSAALGPELAGLIALIVADGELSPALLAASLDFIADSNACHQDAESENACAAMCAGLAVQCKPCADERACRNALQRVCGGQLRVDRCQ